MKKSILRKKIIKKKKYEKFKMKMFTCSVVYNEMAMKSVFGGRSAKIVPLFIFDRKPKILKSEEEFHKHPVGFYSIMIHIQYPLTYSYIL